ncbi:hypothetical protein CS006_02285 [Bifidobacterium primatium]|uniref:Transcriptional regulator n=1 Tax=Bifidobacterium primatium TaxID=2045438 RepID=A0A2M9HB25_9BIFI|nr:hypothetical protein CS006_02285 [Bifidobacterium primatium]
MRRASSAPPTSRATKTPAAASPTTETTEPSASSGATRPTERLCTHCHDNGTHDADADAAAPHDAHHDAVDGAHNGYDADQKKILARLSRIEGQIRGIRQMTENGEYCIDILTQIAAANSALKSVAMLLLDDHLNHCVRQAAAEGGDVADEKLNEASAAIRRLVKS